jgi:hypothetical protein
VFPDNYVADDHGGLIHISSGWDAGHYTLKSADHKFLKSDQEPEDEQKQIPRAAREDILTWRRLPCADYERQGIG